MGSRKKSPQKETSPILNLTLTLTLTLTLYGLWFTLFAAGIFSFAAGKDFGVTVHCWKNYVPCWNDVKLLLRTGIPTLSWEITLRAGN